MRAVQIDLSEILDLVSSAVDYGFADDVLMGSLYEFCGDVTDHEIDDHARTVSEQPGYSDEDRQEISERLTEWRDKHRSLANQKRSS